MSTAALKRLKRDFIRLQQDPPTGIQAAPLDNNVMAWQAVIFGPDNTPWEGATFKLLLEFTEDYPFKPPVVRFLSKLFHPNVNTCAFCAPLFYCMYLQTLKEFYFYFSRLPSHIVQVYGDGKICLDILQNQWSPSYDIATILTSIQSLLSDPNPACSANAEATQLYECNRREYNKRVREVVEQSWMDEAAKDTTSDAKDSSTYLK